MIFTRRFGALAARRTFPHVTELEQEQTPELPVTDVDVERTVDASAA